MGIKIGDISPLGGAITGEGILGKGLVAAGDALGPAAGLMPMVASKLEKRRKRKKKPGEPDDGMRKGGKVKKMAKGGKVNCRRGDGICRQGRTKGKMM
jgi:hypothetical protein